MKSKLLGIIAEDRSDVDVVYNLTQKITRRPFRIKPVLGHGCGKIRSKSQAWAENLRRYGCTLLIIITDLDRNDYAELSDSLRLALDPCPIQKNIIVIPVHEIEAWLLADHDAVSDALRLRKRMKKEPNPEAIVNPKERLRDIIDERSNSRTTYLNTVHNEKIARHVHINNLNRCRSFMPFRDFINLHLAT